YHPGASLSEVREWVLATTRFFTDWQARLGGAQTESIEVPGFPLSSDVSQKTSSVGLGVVVTVPDGSYSALSTADQPVGESIQRFKINHADASPNFSAIWFWQEKGGSEQPRITVKTERREVVATYALHPGDTVVTRDLARFNIRPFAIRLTPVLLPADTIQLSSKAKSIEFVGAPSVEKNLTGRLRLMVRNV